MITSIKLFCIMIPISISYKNFTIRKYEMAMKYLLCGLWDNKLKQTSQLM